MNTKLQNGTAVFILASFIAFWGYEAVTSSTHIDPMMMSLMNTVMLVLIIGAGYVTLGRRAMNYAKEDVTEIQEDGK